MRSYLRYDQDARELRLVLTDLWRGQHERTEFPLSGDTHRGQDLDGAAVIGNGYAEPYRAIVGEGIMARRLPFDVEQTAAVTVKTPCRRLASASGRARCTLCAAEHVA